MRHNKKFNHLGRKSAHRKSMLSNMCVSLIMHKRIFYDRCQSESGEESCRADCD